MVIEARRVFRLSLTTALSLAAGYALALDLPHMAPLLAFFLTAAPKPPMRLKAFIGMVLVICITLGTGLLLVPMLRSYPATALMLVMVGLFVSNYFSLNLGKEIVGLLLTMGVAIISAAGMMGFAIALSLVKTIIIAIGVVLVCQWIVYPFFPEDDTPPATQPGLQPQESSWLALQTTLIVFPSYLLGLYNPQVYLPMIMKAVSLGQQTSVSQARNVGLELLGSTIMGGLFAVLLWLGLGIAPNLWMFFLWIFFFGIYISAKFYGIFTSNFTPSFWQNVMITLLLLVGPAVADSATGKDVYTALLVRTSLFVAVTIYAWMAVLVFDRFSKRQKERSPFPLVTKIFKPH